MSLIPNAFGRRSSVFDPFSLDLWDPFEPFLSLIPPREAGASNAAKETVAAVASARIDWKETSEAHIFKVDLPGQRKDEVKIEVEEGRVMQISGERKREEEEKNERWHRVERSHGKFVRRFRLPDNAKVDEIKAAMDNGVLTITVPKKPHPEPDIKQIQISSA